MDGSWPHKIAPLRDGNRTIPIFICFYFFLLQELNTAEDFISFYEKMMPLVQTLPQVILHKEIIMSELLDRLHVKARLSLEPILMYVVFTICYLFLYTYVSCFILELILYMFYI